MYADGYDRNSSLSSERQSNKEKKNVKFSDSREGTENNSDYLEPKRTGTSRIKQTGNKSTFLDERKENLMTLEDTRARFDPREVERAQKMKNPFNVDTVNASYA